MNLTRIRYFVEVARWGSFSKAAGSLYVSQPNLSRQVSQLEQELGFALFQRSGRNIRLTRAGEYLYQQFRSLPEQVEQAVAQAEAISRQERGSLSIGVLEGQDISALLSQRVAELQERYPGVEVELERNSFRNLRQGLDRGTYDVIFTLAFEVEGRPDWEHLTVFQQPGAIFISRAHPLAARERLSMEDLRGEPFVAISRGESPGGYELLLRQCAAFGFEPNIVRETRSMESLLLCVEMGLGVAILDRNTRLERSEAIRIYTMPDSPAAGLMAVWDRSSRNPMIRRLVEHIPGGPGKV